MGYGQWVGNESVHFEVTYEDKEGRETGSVRGRDPIRLRDVGTNKRRKLTKGTVRVQMRFATLAHAERARKAVELVKVEGVYALQVNVPVTKRPSSRVDPPDPPAEVRLDW
jgi:hypothetical protein